ncbi:RNA ligase family protein [Nostoc sp. CMAA1605]|uniref:RNA ligase family protein n=1 Tax=Nostoc sp. CMAA1605 TaxID=2055159 RepID=UPI001F43479C|nr:RNA ligase family protein [Nostoc sp. CMAA1605]
MSFDFSLRSCDLNKLNSLTKYPSIPTYHALGEKGKLLEETVTFDGEVILTEKVDGTNSRIILLPDGNYVLGSREELLFAKGDLIGNPALGIVNSLKGVADLLPQSQDCITVRDA